jgi:hypothetical protein
VVFDHRVAFIFVIVMANVEVVFQEGDESSASEGGTALIMGKSMLENAIEATAHHPPPCPGQGGQVRTHAKGG